jgi:hypothetical protein
MLGFLDTEELLSDLRGGKSLTDKIYYLSCDSQKTSQNDLMELKSRCTRLGYSFNSVDAYKSDLKNAPLFFYLVRNLPEYAIKQFREYSLS